MWTAAANFLSIWLPLWQMQIIRQIKQYCEFLKPIIARPGSFSHFTCKKKKSVRLVQGGIYNVK
jgi:hypothetical protein